MNTQIIKIDQQNIDKEAIKEASRWIQKKELVAFPTETVYGLGADGLDPEASAKIYAAKGRPSDNPLILHISDIEQLTPLVREIPNAAVKAMRAFWPGPMTMILNKSDIVPFETTGGLSTVAVRMPNHPIALALISESGCPIAAPSANASGRPSPTRAEHVYEDMNGKIPCILDGGMVGIGIESTIIDFSGDTPMILRPGFITKERLEEVIGEPVGIDPAVLNMKKMDGIAPKAPGMKYRHYAPKAKMILVSGREQSVISYINEKTEEAHRDHKKVGVIGTDETIPMYKADVVLSIGTSSSDRTIAHFLYDVLRTFDHEEVDMIYSQVFESGEHGFAIMNRLMKAAGYDRVEV
ncbi:MAG: L-threonylcarbamoyladenylate synthase [Lachnospiraceae bacterium]|nr:L-threonylcarbamoyladenylate synthase [Lachnospiraceae bacterium]